MLPLRFFALPEAEGFVLVGGPALISLQLVERVTEDLDFFTADSSKVAIVADAFQSMAIRVGWGLAEIRATPTFRRLDVRVDSELVRVDIAVDSPPRLPSTVSPVGPTLAPIELAARKLLALFDRAAPRDFVDVFTLVARFGKKRVFDLAAEIDLGLDRQHLADSFRVLDRIPDDRLPCDPRHAPAMRAFFAEWCVEMTTSA